MDVFAPLQRHLHPSLRTVAPGRIEAQPQGISRRLQRNRSAAWDLFVLTDVSSISTRVYCRCTVRARKIANNSPAPARTANTIQCSSTRATGTRQTDQPGPGAHIVAPQCVARVAEGGHPAALSRSPVDTQRAAGCSLVTVKNRSRKSQHCRIVRPMMGHDPRRCGRPHRHRCDGPCKCRIDWPRTGVSPANRRSPQSMMSTWTLSHETAALAVSETGRCAGPRPLTAAETRFCDPAQRRRPDAVPRRHLNAQSPRIRTGCAGAASLPAIPPSGPTPSAGHRVRTGGCRPHAWLACDQPC